MLDFSGKNQMLYWDEVEGPNYGITSILSRTTSSSRSAGRWSTSWPSRSSQLGPNRWRGVPERTGIMVPQEGDPVGVMLGTSGRCSETVDPGQNGVTSQL